MRRWEYMAVEFHLAGEFKVRDANGYWHTQTGPHVTWRTGTQSMQDALRDFGVNGWEMCGVAPSTQNIASHILYFKRELASAPG